MRVAFVVDNPLRDLPGLVLVAANLARRGVVSYLVPMMRQDVELRALAPDAVVLNYLRPTNESFARDCLDAGLAVSVLETEGSQLGDLQLFGRTMAHDRSVHERLVAYFAWGERLGAHVAGAWYRPEQVVVSGQPRFDFYAPRWRAAALAAAPYANDVRRPMVLVIGSFALSNPGFQTRAREARMIAEVFGGDPERVASEQALQEQGLDEIVALVRLLASRLPEVTFVYRPHPFERIETYAGRLRGLPNARLEQIGGAEGWILRAAAVVQRSSTIGIEAGMAGVPALTPTWVDSPYPEAMATVDAATLACPDADALVEAVERAVTGGLELPAPARAVLDETLRAWFGPSDGSAHERVADALLAGAEGRANVSPGACRRIGLASRGGLAGIWRRARQTAKARLPSHVLRAARAGPSALRARSPKDFDEADVMRLIEAVASSEPGYGPAAVSVRRARRGRDYRNGISFGRSVVVSSRQ